MFLADVWPSVKSSSKEMLVHVKCFVNSKTLFKYKTVLMYILCVLKWLII